MSWYLTAKIGMSQKDLNKKLKGIVRSSPFFLFLFDEFDISVEQIDDNLTFMVKKMDGRYGQGNSKYIFLNEKIFQNGGPLEDKMHFVAHELIHWLTRQREKKFYFADPEEINAFLYGIMFELLRGQSKKEIVKLFYPIIEAHFDDKKNAKKLFSLLFILASKKAKIYSER